MRQKSILLQYIVLFIFVLDCLFSFLYKYNFDSNTKITKEKAYMIERNKNRGDDDGF